MSRDLSFITHNLFRTLQQLESDVPQNVLLSFLVSSLNYDLPTLWLKKTSTIRSSLLYVYLQF